MAGHSIQEVEVGKLLLDVRNPRHDILGSQTDTLGEIILDHKPTFARESQLDFGEPTESYTNGTSITMLRHSYDVSKITEEEVIIEAEKKEDDNAWIYIIAGIAGLACVLVGIIIIKKRKLEETS